MSLVTLFPTLPVYAEYAILVLGDSLSAAYQLMPSEGWVNLLERDIKQCQQPYKVINLSTSGDTTLSGLQKLPLALKESNIKLVILELGGNDGLRGLPITIIRKNLKKMIEMSLAENADVLLIGMKLPPNYGKTYSQAFHQIYYDLAKEFNVTLLPFLLEGIALNKAYMLQDGIHANAEGQPLILHNVKSKLSAILDLKGCENPSLEN